MTAPLVEKKDDDIVPNLQENFFISEMERDWGNGKVNHNFKPICDHLLTMSVNPENSNYVHFLQVIRICQCRLIGEILYNPLAGC